VQTIKGGPTIKTGGKTQTGSKNTRHTREEEYYQNKPGSDNT